MTATPTPVTVPDKLAQTIRQVHGEQGVAWLARFPTLLTDIAVRWQLEIGIPFPNWSYNWVAPAVRADGMACVVKAGVPSRELTTESEALRLWDGQGAVRLLSADLDAGVLLLERLQPGRSLLPVRDAQDDVRKTEIAAQVFRSLPRLVPSPGVFPTVTEWAEGFDRLRVRFDGTTGPLPARLVAQAEALFAEQTASTADNTPVLLHGDLHHDNIVFDQARGWLAIDPKGVIGPPIFEVTSYLLNGLPAPQNPSDAPQRMARRVAVLSEVMGLDAARIREWTLARVVLSAWWTIEDNGDAADWQQTLAIADLLNS